MLGFTNKKAPACPKIRRQYR